LIDNWLAGLGRWILLLTSTGTLLFAFNAASAEQANSTGHNWALLVGVGEYDDDEWRELLFTKNDVNAVEDALVNRGNYSPDRVVRLYNENCDALWCGIRDFLKRPKQGDLVLVYHTGHGDKADDGRVYLVPRDYNSENPSKTGIEVAELRKELSACEASTKIVIIDSCYAGASDAPGDAQELNKLTDEELKNRVSADEIRRVFNADDVITMASSTQDQISVKSNLEDQSLFSSWLARGLKGHADTNPIDGKVTFEELFTFVDLRVRKTVKNQTPARQIGKMASGELVLARLQPQPEEIVIQEMAEQIVWATASQGLGPIEVAEKFADDFTVANDRFKDGVRDKYGALGYFYADLLSRSLLKHAGHMLSVDSSYARRTLKGANRNGDDSTTSNDVPELSPTSDRSVNVVGRIIDRQSDNVFVRAEARTDDGDIICQVGGTVSLTSNKGKKRRNEYPLVGNSIAVKPKTDFIPLRDSAGAELSPEASAVRRWDQPKRLSNRPLRDPLFPFRVDIVLAGEAQPEPIVYRGDQAYVGLDKGDEYRIRITYRDLRKVPGAYFDTSEQVAVKVLVDGLSIFDQELPASFQGLPAARLIAKASRDQSPKRIAKGIALEIIENAAPTSLADATPWPLLPAHLRDDNRDDRAYLGYYVGTEGLYCPLQVVDATESLAAERGFTDSIGLITAVFYEDLGHPLGADSDLATRPGPLRRGPQLTPVPVGELGRELGMVSIRYVSRNALRRP
jgi:hypothetical protein